ncbi:MAG: hypothetical protein VW440_04565 [Bordetella sp.]|jgi:hypothetical protein
MWAGLFKDKQKESYREAKKLYEDTCSITNNDRAAHVARVRTGLRCRAVLDKTFIEGAEKSIDYSEHCLVAMATQEPKPEEPKATAFQVIKTVNGDIVAYLPLTYAEEVFKLGALYQNEQITAEQSIEYAQAVADQVSEELKLVPAFQALDFLREQIEEDNAAASLQDEYEAKRQQERAKEANVQAEAVEKERIEQERLAKERMHERAGL